MSTFRHRDYLTEAVKAERRAEDADDAAGVQVLAVISCAQELRRIAEALETLEALALTDEKRQEQP